MQTRDGTRRAAFTLLEVILAMAIGALLLGALYFALDAQLRNVDAGRGTVQESTLARSVLARMAGDISASLPPYVPPKPSASGNASGGQGAGGQGASSGTGASTTSGSSTAQAQPAGSGSVSGPILINLGLQGDSNHLILYIGRRPRELDPLMTNSSGSAPTTSTSSTTNPPLVSDLRRVTYWLAGGSSEPLGLARQEVKLVTSDDAMSAMPPNVDEAALVIAEEVRSLTFRYFDGQSWQDSWDGTTPDAATGRPIGPPLAVEIQLAIAPARRKLQPDPLSLGASPTAGKTFRHVVAIPTANGMSQANSNAAPTTP